MRKTFSFESITTLCLGFSALAIAIEEIMISYRIIINVMNSSFTPMLPTFTLLAAFLAIVINEVKYSRENDITLHSHIQFLSIIIFGVIITTLLAYNSAENYEIDIKGVITFSHFIIACGSAVLAALYGVRLDAILKLNYHIAKGEITADRDEVIDTINKL